MYAEMWFFFGVEKASYEDDDEWQLNGVSLSLSFSILGHTNIQYKVLFKNKLTSAVHTVHTKALNMLKHTQNYQENQLFNP